MSAIRCTCDLPMILFSRNDFPVPALPVKNTLRPRITASRTMFCSLFNVTGRATILDGLIPLVVFDFLAAGMLGCWFSESLEGSSDFLLMPTEIIRVKLQKVLKMMSPNKKVKLAHSLFCDSCTFNCIIIAFKDFC